MATELTMPQMGYDMQEGTLVRWLKDEGAQVKMGEPIAEIETDKAVVEFESYAEGVLRRILVSEGATVPVGQTIAIVGAADEEIDGALPSAPAPERKAAREAPVRSERQAAPTTRAQAAPAAPASGPVKASPVARRIADERGVDLKLVRGTGPGGRITKEDVLAFADAPMHRGAREAPPVEKEEAPATPPRRAPAAPRPAERPAAARPGEIIPLSRMRQQIARVTVRSKTEKPHFYVTADIDMTQAMQLRQQVNKALESEGIRVSVNDLIIKASVEALKKHPKFNAFLQEDGIQMNEQINVGIAVAGEDSLIVPAILDCGSKSLREIAVASKDLAERAQKGTLRPDEYTGGTFAISNLGMFNVTSFVAIIQPPHTAILAVGTVTKQPIVRDDQIAIGQIMTATLAADHRIVDGAEGARFLVEIKNYLENPLTMMV
ncbi:MAG: 2-oxo acid dehydrogenase subunit E2 [Chloroflexi bacterium]|nr:2-oxo acid dehydrogenase subunit E2 [Chloroflexota bacterium]